MSKQGGMGDNCWIDQYDMSGDVGSLGNIGCPMGVLEVTGIKKSAFERIGALHDGVIEFSSFFNIDDAAPAEGAHVALSGLPTTDRQVTYSGGSLGDPAASLISKQIGYDGNRETSRAFTFAVSAQANGYGLEWGNLITDGIRTDTSGGNGTGVDFAASTSFGWVAYLHVFSITGTSVTVKIQDSADNSSWSDVTSAAFTAASARGKQRIESASATATVRRYVRAVSSGTFTEAIFGVNFVKFEQARS